MVKHLSNLSIMLLFLVIMATPFVSVQAQISDPPIPIEIVTGHKRFWYQMVMKKHFTPESKFGLFTVTQFFTTYENNSDNNQLNVPVQIDYDFLKTFSIFGGVRVNSDVGITPIFGPKHTYGSQKWLTITQVAYYTSDKDLQMLGIYEYKPPVNEKLSLYFRIQAMYIRSLDTSAHGRSYLYARIGLKSGRWYYGLGANLDRFGPTKRTVENFGPTLRYDFL